MKQLILYKPLHPFIISQGFGVKNKIYSDMGMLGHNGLDCVRGEVQTAGSYVRAAHDGLVTYSGIDASGGYGVVIKSLEQFDYNGQLTYFKTICWHLEKNIAVKVGQQVKVGDILGFADTTGIATGPHLHFGLKPIAQGENEWTWMNIIPNNGYFGAIDPLPYLSPWTAYECMIAPSVFTPYAPVVPVILTPAQKQSIIGLLIAFIADNAIIEKIKNIFGISPTFGGVSRSPLWPAFRKAHIKDHCECCGKKGTLLKPLELHHVQPYNKNPARELDPTNVITGCRRCHQLIYHLDSFFSWNINAKENAQVWKHRIDTRP